MPRVFDNIVELRTTLCETLKVSNCAGLFKSPTDFDLIINDLPYNQEEK